MNLNKLSSKKIKNNFQNVFKRNLMGYNKVILLGTVGKDSILRTSQNGKAYAVFPLATNEMVSYLDNSFYFFFIIPNKLGKTAKWRIQTRNTMAQCHHRKSTTC